MRKILAKLTGKDWTALGGLTAACLGLAVYGIACTRDALDLWYPSLQKPAWAPPIWLLGAVWMLMFATLATAAGQVWRSAPGDELPGPVALFVVELALHAAWLWLFFDRQLPGIAFIELIVLWLVGLAMAGSFARRSKLAAFLVAPHLAWVAYIGAINFAIWSSNG